MLFDTLVKIHETSVQLKHINIGGGFPVIILPDASRWISRREQTECSPPISNLLTPLPAWNASRIAALTKCAASGGYSTILLSLAAALSPTPAFVLPPSVIKTGQLMQFPSSKDERRRSNGVRE